MISIKRAFTSFTKWFWYQNSQTNLSLHCWYVSFLHVLFILEPSSIKSFLAHILTNLEPTLTPVNAIVVSYLMPSCSWIIVLNWCGSYMVFYFLVSRSKLSRPHFIACGTSTRTSAWPSPLPTTTKFSPTPAHTRAMVLNSGL